MTRSLSYRLALLCALVLPLFTMAQQTGTIKGFVYEQESGEPSIFTPVSVVGTTLGATTDDQGYFSISRVPAGTHTLRIVYLGFDTLTKTLEVKANQIVNEKLYLKKTAIESSTPYCPR